MNNKILKILFDKASEENAPGVDVGNRVISIIFANEIKPQIFWDKPLMLIAALSSVAAIPIAILAFLLHNAWIGPLYEISQAVSWAM